MSKFRWMTLAATFAATSLLTAGEPPHGRDIVDTAVSAGQFKTLTRALGAANLVDALRGDGPFTVFAPTDEAFGAIPDHQLASLLKKQNRDKLASILTYHVVPGKVLSTDLTNGMEAATVEGSDVTIMTEGGVTVEEANVVTADIETSNGVIHVIDQVILPVHGAGLWSTLYGYLSVEADGKTVRGLRFYEHAETACLGDQIDKPDWRALWPGKELYDSNGEAVIEVVRGKAPEGPNLVHQVDGMSGATLTGQGVMYLVRYWVGPDALGPYLDRIGREAG